MEDEEEEEEESSQHFSEDEAEEWAIEKRPSISVKLKMTTEESPDDQEQPIRIKTLTDSDTEDLGDFEKIAELMGE